MSLVRPAAALPIERPRITGVEFDAGWRGRVEQVLDGCAIPYLGRNELIDNKRATGRAQDLVDVLLLEGPNGER